MNENLLRQFLDEDCDEQSRRKLLRDIRDSKAHPGLTEKSYTFNRFNLTLKFYAAEAVIQDDLRVGPEGDYTLGLDIFAKALEMAS
jgi:hypothetical protein